MWHMWRLGTRDSADFQKQSADFQKQSADFQLTARLFTHSAEMLLPWPTREQQAKHAPEDTLTVLDNFRCFLRH